MPLKDILKRKPEYASANFWGGKATEWKTVDGKRQKVEVEKEGWFDEMCRKTLIREVYSAKHLPRDPQKIDDAYQFMKAREARFAEIQAQAEIDAQANIIPIDTTPTAPAALGAPPQPITIPETNPGTEEVIGGSGRPVTASEGAVGGSGQPMAQGSLYDGPNF